MSAKATRPISFIRIAEPAWQPKVLGHMIPPRPTHYRPNDSVGGEFQSERAALKGATRPPGGLAFVGGQKTRPEAAFHLRGLHRSGFRALLALLAGCLLALTTPLHAASGGFAATLSLEQQSSAGLGVLSAAERAALDQLVAGELALVRTGESPELPGTFVSRRTDAEREATGLDRLSPTQLTKLNGLIADALAVRPKPKERQRLKDSDVFSEAKPQIHGSVTLAYGWGSGGRDFWGSSLWLNYYDPAKGFGLSIGLSNYSGDGLFGCYPDYYGSPYYGRSRYFGSSWGYPDYPFGDGYRDDYFIGDGQSFRNQSDWGAVRRDFRRR